MAETAPEGVEQNGEIVLHPSQINVEIIKSDPMIKDCETHCLDTHTLVALVNGTRENGTSDDKGHKLVETNGVAEVS